MLTKRERNKRNKRIANNFAKKLIKAAHKPHQFAILANKFNYKPGLRGQINDLAMYDEVQDTFATDFFSGDKERILDKVKERIKDTDAELALFAHFYGTKE